MELTGRDGRGAASRPVQSRMCVHKLVDQSIRVDQIDLNVWQGEGGHRCIYNLVRWAVPPPAGINSATAGGSEEAAVPSAGSRSSGLARSHPSRTRIWWCRGRLFVPYPCFFPPKYGCTEACCLPCSQPPTGCTHGLWAGGTAAPVFRAGSPSQPLLQALPTSTASQGVDAPEPEGSWEVGRASPLPTSSRLHGIRKQAGPCHLPGFSSCCSSR